MPGLRPIARVTALCLGLLLVVTGGPAAAAPRVMVWSGRSGVPLAPVEDELRAQGVEVVDRAQVLEALGRQRAARADDEQRGREEVERALADAQAHYLALELSAMLVRLEQAEPLAVALARADRCEGLWELEFRRGLGLWAGGTELDRREASARFELALALDPERRPLDELYGPDVTAAFLGAVAEHSARLARPVALRVEPADATVELDCRTTSAREPSLRPGLHAVRVSAPGFAPWAGVVDLRERSAVEVALQPVEPQGDPLLRLAASADVEGVDDGSPSAHALVLAAARSQGAEAVLVVAPRKGAFRVRPWGRDGIGSAVERPRLAEALRVAVGLLDDDGQLRAPAPRVATTPDPGAAKEPTRASRKPVLRTWWLWTIVGGAVVTGTALGLGLGLGLREPAPGRLVIVAR